MSGPETAVSVVLWAVTLGALYGVVVWLRAWTAPARQHHQHSKGNRP